MPATIHIDGMEKIVDGGFVRVEELYAIAGCGEEKRIFLNREDDIDIPLLPGEMLVVRGGEKFTVDEGPIEENNPPLQNPVRLRFNRSREIAFPKAKTTGEDLKKLDEEFPEGRLFVEIKSEIAVEIRDESVIVVQDEDSYLVVPGNGSEGPIVVEECGKHGRLPPRWKSYQIRIDDGTYLVDSEKITRERIWELVDKNSDDWSLNMKLHGGRRERIEADIEVDLTVACVERFETIRKYAQQGQDPYELEKEEVEYLNAHYLSMWNKVSEGDGKYGLVIEKFPLPPGYEQKKSDLMILVPSGYPAVGPDMFYFFPPLEKSDGSGIEATDAIETHFSREWQRWSRHYKWNPGKDDLVSHIEYIQNELNKGAS